MPWIDAVGAGAGKDGSRLDAGGGRGLKAAPPGQMGSTGGNCKRWWDNQDRDCKNNEKMRFLVVADEDFRNCMRIPQEFGSYLRKNISDTIKLDAPNGRTYDIQVCREMGEIVLRSGWDVFADAHNLEENDYLVFMFCGSSSFKVQIYSSCGGSQKITSCVNPDHEILEDVPPRTTSDHHVPKGNQIPHPGHVQTPACFEYFTTGGSRLTKAQDKKVLEIASTIKSEIPLYVAVMNKSNVELNGCIIIPSILMEVREKVLKATVELEAPDANVYSVSAIQQGTDEIVLKSGWDSFVAAHHVQERDLIIFRHKRNSRLEVFILDPSGYEKNSTVEIVEPTHKTVGIIDLSSSSDDENNVAAYSAKSARRHKQQLDHFAKTRRMASTSCPSIISEHDGFPLNSNNSEEPTGPPYIISRMVTLSRAQEKMVLEKVQAIQSGFPIYVAVINRSRSVEAKKGSGSKMVIFRGAYWLSFWVPLQRDEQTKDILSSISRRLETIALERFAMDYSRRCLPSETQDRTLQLEGCHSKQWLTLLHVQGGDSRCRGMRRISRGWAQFVRDNHLKQGDICLFELVKATRSLRMKVHLICQAGADM